MASCVRVGGLWCLAVPHMLCCFEEAGRPTKQGRQPGFPRVLGCAPHLHVLGTYHYGPGLFWLAWVSR